MYRILTMASDRKEKSLFRYYLEKVDGKMAIYETESEIELKQKVHDLLDNYNKDEILIVCNLDWDVLVSIDGEVSNVTEADVEEIYNETEGEVFGDEE